MTDLFGPDGHATWLQECARAGTVFLCGLLLIRIGGRRVLGQWAALDIVVAVITGSNLSRAITGNAPLFGTLAATTLLMALYWAFAQAAARSVGLACLLEGSAIELGRDSALDASALRRHSVSRTDIQEALRQSGVEHVGQTRRLILEPGGRISVLRC